MQMNKRGLTFSAAFILAIKNNDLLANPSSTYWASRASSAWAICSLSVFCCFSLTHPSFPFSPSHSASFTPCRPPESERQAFETLNLTKLIFRRRRRTTRFPPLLPPRLLLRLRWHFALKKVCHIWGGGRGGMWNTRELSQLGVQNIPQGIRLPRWSLAALNELSLAKHDLLPSDNIPLCTKGGLESLAMATVAKWHETW